MAIRRVRFIRCGFLVSLSLSVLGLGALACSQGAEGVEGEREVVARTEQGFTSESLFFQATTPGTVTAGETPPQGSCTQTTDDGGVYYKCKDGGGGDNIAHASWSEAAHPCSDGGAGDAGDSGEAGSPCLGENVTDQAYSFGPSGAYAPAAAVTAKAHASITTTAGLNYFYNGTGHPGPSSNVTGSGMAGVDTTTTTPPPYMMTRKADFHGKATSEGPGFTIVNSANNTDGNYRALVTETATASVLLGDGYGSSGTAKAHAGGTSISIVCSKFSGNCHVTTSTSRIGHGSQCPGSAAECQLSDAEDYYVTLVAGADGGTDAAPPSTSVAVVKSGKSIQALGASINVGSSTVTGSSVDITGARVAGNMTNGFASVAAASCPATGNCSQ